MPKTNSLPSTERLLISGGDARLELDPTHGQNKYGCSPFPDPELLAFGSSTASNISTEAYTAANQLREQLSDNLNTDSPSEIYARTIEQLRSEWIKLCGLSELSGLELVFSPSGTDLHAIAAQYTASGASPAPLIIMVETGETGSGVFSALLDGHPVEIAQLAIRKKNGMPRPLTDIDNEVALLTVNAAASNRRVLLITVDQSKTGLIAPSPGCVMALQRQYPDHVDVLVDACQFRIATETLRAYLTQGFTVALTGSKFLTGPAFSAMWLIPAIAAERLRQRPFPQNIATRSSQADWPNRWPGRERLRLHANFGLLVRSTAALEELRRFRNVPQADVLTIMQNFAESIRQHLLQDPHFEPLTAPDLERTPLSVDGGWDRIQSIFPFILYRSQINSRIGLNREQTRQIYQRLAVPGNAPNGGIRCQLGQPVACGIRGDTDISALRLCLSSRLIADAARERDNGDKIIKDAQAALDKTAWLIQMLG